MEAVWVGLLFAVIVGLWLGSSLSRWRSKKARRRANAERLLLAGIGERAGAELLEQRGYGVVQVQPRQVYRIWVDRTPMDVEVRADYLVSRGRTRWVADVKTGLFAPRLSNRNTRRQLLEYSLAYDVDGVLLVDMENREIRRIEFDAKRGTRPKTSNSLRLILAASLGLLIGIAALGYVIG